MCFQEKEVTISMKQNFEWKVWSQSFNKNLQTIFNQCEYNFGMKHCYAIELCDSKPPPRPPKTIT